MERNINLFGNEFSVTWKNILLLGILAIFPNILGMAVLETPFGFNLHIFQILIFAAALIYGPFGGMVSGGFGSVWAAILLNNPYIVIGSIILGGVTGYLAKNKGINIIAAAMIAFTVQLPWLWFSDIYLAGMPIVVVNGVVWALLVSNFIMAALVFIFRKRIVKLVQAV
ncbi:MAG: hypothetical protein ABID38_00320 [Candidatus Diapherotrites archaeon]